METPKLGQLITSPAERDAVHVAVAPVVAAGTLDPGDHVGLDEDGEAGRSAEPKIGIVDPFLRHHVVYGERFYLFLYPGTVESLRHDWTHPAFEAAVTLPHDDDDDDDYSCAC